MKTLKLVKIYSLIILYSLLFIAGFVGSQLTQSLVLLLDSYHNLYTTLSLLLLVISHKLPHAQTLKNTFGWVRVEILGTLFNIIFFSALCFSVAVEGIQTLAHAGHEDVEPSYPMALVVAGLVGMVLHVLVLLVVGDIAESEGGFLSITGHDVMVNRQVTTEELTADIEDWSKPSSSNDGDIKFVSKQRRSQCSSAIEEDREVQDQLLSKKSLLKVRQQATMAAAKRNYMIRRFVRDFCSSVLLIVTGAAVIFCDWHQIEIVDPVMGLLSVIILGVTFYPIMKASGLILLQTVPKHIDVECLKKAIIDEFVPDILSIHDLHIWCLTSDKIIATCHVTLAQHTTTFYVQLSRRLEKFLALHGITLATIQPEFEQVINNRSSYRCLYRCKSNKQSDCMEKKCCHEKDDEECEAVLSHVH